MSRKKNNNNKKQHRITKIEKKLIELWDTLGTIEFQSYSDLAMMLDETDREKVRKVIHQLIDNDKLYLDYDKRWILDYIPF